MSTLPDRYFERAAARARRGRAALAGLAALALTLLGGCGPVRLVANTNIPAPLVVKIPIGVALLMPKEFVEYVHTEERWNTDWRIELGRAQSDAIMRLLTAMFERVVPVENLGAAASLGPDVRAVLEPSIEEYAFVTPRDAGPPFYAVSIKYRVNIYLPDGKLADSWGFTGYGTSPAQGLSNTSPLAAATALAMRDAGAKLAVEFREQAIVRGLLPASETADTVVAPTPAPAVTSEPVAPGGSSAPAPAQQEKSQDETATPPNPTAAPGSPSAPQGVPPPQEPAPEPQALGSSPST